MRLRLPTRTRRYIWQRPDWPNLTYDAATLAGPLAQVHRAQGQLSGRMTGLDVTLWLGWFLGCLLRAVQGADALLAGVLDKARFWQRWAGTPMSKRQAQVLSNAKWAALGKCSADTALRDINDLLARGVLRKLEGGGRSTGYELCIK